MTRRPRPNLVFCTTRGLGACAVVLMLVGTCACRSGETAPVAQKEPSARALELSRRLLIIDTHIDTPYRLTNRPTDVAEASDDGNFDYPRAMAGGLNVPFMSIYVPASYQESGGAREFADELIDMVEGIAAERPDRFRMVHQVEQAVATLGQPWLGLAMGMENGAPIEDDLANVEHFHRRGIRYITLVHSENNLICDSSYADEKSWNGLSPFGREVVAEMNRVGIMVDVSHVTDEAFYQVLEVTRAPVIASHSSCRHFTPGWERNMDDGMIRALADNGGVIQINFGSDFIDDAYRLASKARRDAIRGHLDEHEIDRDSEEARSYASEYRENHPIEVADVSDVADHIDHVVGLAGIDHVGLGSDFDGVGDSLPTGLKDVSMYPRLIDELLDRGYSEADIGKVCGGNLIRVWSAVERVAAESG